MQEDTTIRDMYQFLFDSVLVLVPSDFSLCRLDLEEKYFVPQAQIYKQQARE